MINNKLIPIPGRLHDVSTDGVVTGADEIFDDAKGKSQSVINQETDAALGNKYDKDKTYSKEELNNLITTPNQKYVTVENYDSLPATGEADTIYRVSNYDGKHSQVDATKYSEYAWDGTQYVFLCVKTQIGEVFDITAYNSNTKYADLSAALSGDNVPVGVRKGGMSVKFIQSSDNKYVQYRLMVDSWSINTEDWAIAEEGVYVENPEFVYVKTDAEGKILWAIKTDGSIYYGAGVPQQVIDYIEEKLAELSLDEYEDIVAFLNDLEKGDKTLQTLLDEKVDKEEDKSLIDVEYANGVHYIENPEFVEVVTDNEDRILYAVKADGDFYFGAGVPQQVIDYVIEHTDATKEELLALINTKVDKEDGKSLIDSEFAGGINYIENPEFVKVETDKYNKVYMGVLKDGTVYIPKLRNSAIDEIQKRHLVILDTDLGADIDDFMELAMLCLYAQKGMVDLVGVNVTLWYYGNDYTSATAIDSMCTYYGIEKICVGKSDFLNYQNPGNGAVEAVSKGYKHTYNVNSVLEDSKDFYRRALMNIPEGEKCDIFIGGFLTGFAGILNDVPQDCDDTSTDMNKWSGRMLVSRKVNVVYIIGGCYPYQERTEWNFTAGGNATAITATDDVLTKCPVKMKFIGVGEGVNGVYGNGYALYEQEHDWSILYKGLYAFAKQEVGSGATEEQIANWWRNRITPWGALLGLIVGDNNIEISAFQEIPGTNVIDNNPNSETYGFNTFTYDPNARDCVLYIKSPKRAEYRINNIVLENEGVCVNNINKFRLERK